MFNIKRFQFAFLSLVIFFISLNLYHQSLNYFFFQDDYFEINISKADTFGQYLNFYKFRDDIIAYRPVSLQNFFFLSSRIFGFDPGGFRVITFTLFFSSAILLIVIAKKITGNREIGLLSAFFWLTSSIHFMSITWIAAAYNIIGTFFWLLTSLLFLKFIENKKAKFYLPALITFIITICSFEFSITWPVIFAFYYFYVLSNSLSKTLKIFSPFIIISIVYLILRFFLINVPRITEYQITVNINSIKALFWYVLWTFNIPEEFKKQIANNLLIFNEKFLLDYWQLVLKTFVGAIWIVTLGIFLPIALIINRKLQVNFKLIVFFLIWFCFGILPVLILPNHTFTMYLTLASVGFYLLIAYLLIKSQMKLLTVSILVIWLFTSFTTLSFYKVNSWMVETQKSARKTAVNLKKSYPTLPSNSIVLYRLNSQWEKQALSEDNAIKAFYNDQTLSIYYNKETLLRNVNMIGNHPVYIYLPR